MSLLWHVTRKEILFYFSPTPHNIRIHKIGKVKYHLIHVTSIPRSSLQNLPYNHTWKKSKVVIWTAHRKAALELQGSLRSHLREDRPLFLFSHSRPDHIQKAAKFPKCVYLTTCPPRSSTCSALKAEAKSHKQQEIKSNSDNTVGGRTASHEARETNSSAFPWA